MKVWKIVKNTEAPDAFGVALVARLGLDHGQLVVAEGEDVVGDLRLAAAARAFDAAGADRLTADTAVGDDAPPRFPQSGVDEFGAGLGLVHAVALPWAECDTKCAGYAPGSASKP